MTLRREEMIPYKDCLVDLGIKATSLALLLSVLNGFDYRRSDGDNKQAEMTKRKLSADLNLTKNKIAIRQRDGRLKNKSNKKKHHLKPS